MSGVWIPGLTLAELLAVVVGDDYSTPDDFRVIDAIKERAVEVDEPPAPTPTTED